ncbi:MAG: thioredoxin family protein [Idiomarina sp.]|nr:thioredoxin family protein [Idiomarina sp.]
MKTFLSTMLVAAVALSAVIYSTTSHASTEHLEKFKQPFTESAYRQAQADAQLVLIDVYATWCPTCKRQQDVLDSYFPQNPDSELVVFEVDYDSQKEWVRYFKAPRQSTLVLERGEQRLWFSVAQTRESAIFAELELHDQGAQ